MRLRVERCYRIGNVSHENSASSLLLLRYRPVRVAYHTRWWADIEPFKRELHCPYKVKLTVVAGPRLVPIAGEIGWLPVGDDLVASILLGLVQRMVRTVDEVIWRRRLCSVQQCSVCDTTGNCHVDFSTTGQFEWT